ncbi:uncharacterized protein LOC111088207 isoform X2 [Limulus polyphemus]|uniref:Uncharacterized protein LOC111088207 isoform X2 n=1 Tax=Limulus polyphemus TaxID=6850 RepID=A0ABM1TBM2_LIMPO|nr:uncharacterized protein LOC111088207 isoform X2 [Limulus polyphemus]
MQEFQQIGVAQNQKDTQFERDRLESEEEQINSNKDGIINTKSTLKRKLLSLDNSGYYDQWKPANENSNIYNKKLSSSLYKYEQPLEEIISYSVDNVDYTQKVENIPVVSPYRPRVKVPLPLTVFSSGNTLDSQKTRFSNTNVPLSQQQDLQAHDENSQLLPGMSVQSDDYRLSEKRPNDIIYSKFVDLHNALEGSHDKISTDGSQTTSFISGQNNRAMLNDIRGSLERSYHSVDWKENAQKLTVNDSEEQNKNERYVRPWETQDKRKTEDFNWKQSDYAQNNKLKVQLKDSQLENKSMSQPVFDSYTEIGLKLSEKMDDTAPAQNLIHRKRERELALLDNISNILNKVRIQLNYVQSYLHRFPGNNNWYPMGTQRYRPLEHSYNNGYSVNAQEQNYYNRYPTETQPQTYHKHKVKGVQSYGNYRNVENALESALDRGTAGFQRKRPLWLELLQRSLIPEVEKDKNPESVFSSKENQYSGNVLSSNFFNPKNALDFSLQNEVQEKSNLPNQSLNSYETLQISDAFNTSRMNGSDVIQLEKTHQRSEVPGYIFDTRKVDAGKLESDEEREEIKDERSSNLRKWESSDEYNEEKSSKQQTNNDETNSNLLWNIKDETSYNQRNGESGINREKSNKKRQWYELFFE